MFFMKQRWFRAFNLGSRPISNAEYRQVMPIRPNESSWGAVGTDFGISGFLELTLYVFMENVGPEHSVLGPNPSRSLNLVK